MVPGGDNIRFYSVVVLRRPLRREVSHLRFHSFHVIRRGVNWSLLSVSCASRSTSIRRQCSAGSGQSSRWRGAADDGDLPTSRCQVAWVGRFAEPSAARKYSRSEYLDSDALGRAKKHDLPASPRTAILLLGVPDAVCICYCFGVCPREIVSLVSRKRMAISLVLVLDISISFAKKDNFSAGEQPLHWSSFPIRLTAATRRVQDESVALQTLCSRMLKQENIAGPVPLSIVRPRSYLVHVVCQSR